jgi:diguanylate cyclase (GGDEF)-like protein
LDLSEPARAQIVGLMHTSDDHGVLNLSVNHRHAGARDIVARWSQLRSDDGHPLGYVGTAEDVTDRNLLAAKLEYQATHDSLTSLPNRQFVLDHLECLLADPTRAAKVAVLFVDLDDFKTINDSLGHEIGDQVLVSVARRIRSSLRPGDVFGRFGGDEFVLVSEGIVSDEQALLLGDRMLETLRVPFVLDAEKAYHCRASVGTVRYYPGSTPASLIGDADAAMYQAKDFGRGRTEIFHPDIRSKVLAKFALESDLREALEDDQFEVYYQPIVSAESRLIIGAEALVRWHHPERGLVSPASFIPLAEKNGLIVAIGGFVLQKACEQLRLLDDLKLSVNLSATVRRALEQSGLPAERLTLEITESILMDDVRGSARILEELKELGVSLAIDDFGTGYSSLYYLSRFHVDQLKVDQSFVARLGMGLGDTEIVKAVINLSHGLGLKTTAEGVETVEQLDALHGLSCDNAQGYLFARPMPFADLRRVVSDSPASRSAQTDQ